MIKLAVDAMGGDLGSSIVIQAVLNYLAQNQDVEFHVVGKLEELQPLEGKAILYDAKEVMGMEDGALTILRKKETSMNKFKDALHSDIKLPKLNELDFSNLYDNHKSIINISTFTLAFSVVFYIILTFSINLMINNKEKETEKAIAQVNQQINELSQYDLQLNNRITRYKSLITNIEQNNEKASEDKRFKNTIPNLLNNLMAIIPKDVELVSIENKNDTHVVIEARSKKYEKLAFFKTKIKTEDILLNVISDTGVGDGEEYIKITIEGELPWKIR